MDKGVYFLSDILDQSANLLSYENFMIKWLFPIKYKEYNSVIKAIPTGLLMLMRSHMLSYNICRSEPVLCLNGVDINSKKCTNTFIRQIFDKNRSIKPSGKFFWNLCFTDIKWEKAWTLPYRFCIYNKLRELHLKILQNIYVSNYTLSRFMDIDGNWSFCSDQPFIFPFYFIYVFVLM